MLSAGFQILFGLLMFTVVRAAAQAAPLKAINLGTAGGFTILAKSGISTVPFSAITGNIGVSPSSGTSLTGFSFIKAPSGTFATSNQVVGELLAADFTSPTSSQLSTAVLDMQTAFVDGNSRLLPNLNLLGGLLSAQTLAPGLYKWTSSVSITGLITLKGPSTGVWIFQIQNNLLYAAGARAVLSGGALAKNIFWVVSGDVSLGAGSTLEGVILGATKVALLTGSAVHGSILSQTAVTLEKATVVPV
ncbi:hypothetical protein HYPSUDRAFT_218265 [Hypholoma sublateritium FD-334 SS-4]|uniref:Antifreeze protein n=1 Tax=Hypholoma sublateritium (strain FD-334 SS-4) TaxID=945553 RepID=A0A0D2NNJ6_HYPSF|nr:hypothetical protein HYPSUDRAFT_218265 [Hypholoma sublateritium FD-334 SS-4]